MSKVSKTFINLYGTIHSTPPQNFFNKLILLILILIFLFFYIIILGEIASKSTEFLTEHLQSRPLEIVHGVSVILLGVYL